MTLRLSMAATMRTPKLPVAAIERRIDSAASMNATSLARARIHAATLHDTTDRVYARIQGAIRQISHAERAAELGLLGGQPPSRRSKPLDRPRWRSPCHRGCKVTAPGCSPRYHPWQCDLDVPPLRGRSPPPFSYLLLYGRVQELPATQRVRYGMPIMRPGANREALAL